MEFSVKTSGRTEFINITQQIKQAVEKSGVKDGAVVIYVPHTTAGVTINEGADPAVMVDLKKHLDKSVPWNAAYSHSEGNSAAHIKSTLVGATEHVLIDNGKIMLGTWQKIYFCEFDGPRTRNIWVKIIGNR